MSKTMEEEAAASAAQSLQPLAPSASLGSQPPRPKPKKATLTTWMTLQSIPEETIITPTILQFLEQALEPLPTFNPAARDDPLDEEDEDSATDRGSSTDSGSQTGLALAAGYPRDGRAEVKTDRQTDRDRSQFEQNWKEILTGFLDLAFKQHAD